MAIKDLPNNDSTVAKSPSGRVRRTPIGRRNILTVGGKDPNYVYRIVNDEGDRIEQFRAAGYDTVSAHDHTVGDRRINAPSTEGSVAQASVGGGVKGIVMRIKKEWYEEDQKAKQADLAAVEASTKQNALADGNYGKIDISRD